MVIVIFVFKNGDSLSLGIKRLRHEYILRYWLIKNSYSFKWINQHGCLYLSYMDYYNNISEKLA